VHLRDQAETLLRRLTGRPDATFGRGQWEAIETLVDPSQLHLSV
jgi:hypothetical protein